MEKSQEAIQAEWDIQTRQRDAKNQAIANLHAARVELGQAGFHDMAREVASLINTVSNAIPNGNPVT